MAEEDQTERRPHSTKQRFLFRGREVDQLVCVHVSLLCVCVCATGNRALMSCGRERVNSIFEYWPAEPQDGILFSSTEPLSRVVLFQAHTHTGHLTPPTICLLRKRERVLYSSAILSNVRLFRTFPVFSPLIFFFILNFIRVVRQMVYNYNGITQTIKGGLGVLLLLLVCVCRMRQSTLRESSFELRE